MKLLRNARLILLGVVCSGVLRVAMAADSVNEPAAFQIPAQSLDSALMQFSQQSGIQLVVTAETVRGKLTQGVRGTLEPTAALKLLLDGSGLEVRVVNERSLAIRAADAALSGGSVNGAHVVADAATVQLAQTAEGSTTAGADAVANSTVTLEEIFVTANKRTENVREIAGSVSALTDAVLARAAVNQLSDYVAGVPGVSLADTGIPGRKTVTIRGVTTGSAQTSPTIGTYIDDSPFGSSTPGGGGADITPDLDPFDLERVEVLRGPQGTLYGASTLGGLLKYVTKAPDLTATQFGAQSGFSRVDGGSSGYTVRARANVPIVEDRLGMRFSVFRRQDPGYIDEINSGRDNVNRHDADGGRVSLLYVPSDQLKIRLSATLQNLDSHDDGKVDVNPSTLVPLYADLTKAEVIDTPSFLKYRAYSASVDYDLGFATLTSATGYNTYDSALVYDFTRVYAPLLQTPPGAGIGLAAEVDARKATEELRLVSAKGERTEWIVGAFYTDEKSTLPQGLDVEGMTNIYSAELGFTYREYAAFGNYTVYITPDFDVTVGTRWSRNEQTFTTERVGRLANPGAPTTLLFGSNDSNDQTWTYLAASRWRVTPEALLYARYATGYRPGGPRNFPPTTLPPDISRTYKPDTVSNYELGLRTEWLDRHLTVDAAGFLIDWDDIQLSQSVQGFNVYDNAGSAVSQGGEFEIRYLSDGGLAVSATASYADATIRTSTPSIGAQRGDRLPNVPRWSAAATVEQSFPLVGNWSGNLSASYVYQADRVTGFTASTSRMTLPAYDAVDLRAAFMNGRWDLSLFIKNVTDERGYAGGVRRSPALPGQLAPIQPRTYGAVLGLTF